MPALRSLLVVAAASLAVQPLARAQSLEEFQARLVSLSAKIRPSVVAVTAYAEEAGEEVVAARFSGVILDTKGHIATVADEVSARKRIVVKLLDGRSLEAKVVGADLITNVGVIRIEASGLEPAAQAPTGAPEPPVGSLVLAVGNPFGLNHSVSWGMVSGTGRTLVGREHRLVRGMIQTTAPVNPGDAGGLLVDLQGRFVGQLSSTYGRSPSMHGVKAMLEELASELGRDPEFKAAASEALRLLMESFGAGNPEAVQKRIEEIRRLMNKALPSGLPDGRPALGAGVGTEGINFVLPAARVVETAGRLIRDGKIVRGQIGIRGLSLAGDPYHRNKYGVPADVRGILVASVASDGPAAKAGVRLFDVLVSLDGELIEDPFDLMERVFAMAPGAELKLRVWRRDAAQVDVLVTVEELARK